MLYPQFNPYRSIQSTPEYWKFKIDPDSTGEQNEWFRSLESDLEIAVPGSWNEQFEEIGLSNYIGKAWFQTSVFIPESWLHQRIMLRIGSADYSAKIWINDIFLGSHRGGFLPFEFDLSASAKLGEMNQLTMMIDNTLSAETIPQGITSDDYLKEKRLREETYPASRFDFFPYGGIHRPVVLYTTPKQFIASIKIDTSFDVQGVGTIKVESVIKGTTSASIRTSVLNTQLPPQTASTPSERMATAHHMPTCRPWHPNDPYLYQLRVELLEDGNVIDQYELPVGIREVTITGGKLLLNGSPVYLTGFGRHEDFPVLGKTYAPALAIKDFSIMKWINANSFRTSHYPYADEIMALADRQGFLIIDEAPAVSLDMRKANAETIVSHKAAIREMIERDYNHPSVIIWALGNEPNLVGEPGYLNGSGRAYWKEIFDFARTLDSSRPMTVPNCTHAGTDDPVFEFSDIVSINRYYGWYEYPGTIDRATEILSREMDVIHGKYPKPMMMTEFGADTIPGFHSVEDQMFTEEYQSRLLAAYIELIRSKGYFIGEHVWNFADFRTPQHFRRVWMNMKGVFTRTRQPKSAAFTLKKIWQTSQ